MGPRTAVIAILSASERQGVFAPPFAAQRAPRPSAQLVPHEELIAMAKRAGVPVLVDMASDLPPWGQLDRFLKAGADLLVLSGGKAIGGPQSSGVLLGRRDLIDAARLNSTPNDNIGRGMKVRKEEIIGLIVALERIQRQITPPTRRQAFAGGLCRRSAKLDSLTLGLPVDRQLVHVSHQHHVFVHRR